MVSVFYNGTVESLGDKNQIYEAIAIDGQRIVALGSSEQLKLQYSNAVQVDLDGAVVYPAFADSHAHIYGTGERVTKPRLEPATSLQEALEIVRQAASSTSEEWIELRGWDQNKWGMSTFPTKQDLAGISDRPIFLTRVDGHAAWLNEPALTAAGIDSETLALSGGEILKTDDGTPNGILLDEAMKLAQDKIPLQSKEQIKYVMLAGLKEFARNGNATVHDMGIPAHYWTAISELYKEEGDTLPRSHVFFDMNQESGRQMFLEIEDDFDLQPHPNLKLVGIKIYLDGALGSRGAELFEAYTDAPGNFGLALSDDVDVMSLMKKAAIMKLQIAVHAIGDKANHRALHLFENSGAWSKTSCRIEHAQIVRDEDLAEYKRLGVAAVIQPPFFPSDRHWAMDRLGAERMRTAYRWNSLVEAGIHTIATSDSPVEPPDSIFGIQTLVGRDGVKDSEALTRPQAIGLYTTEAARLDGQLDQRGTLEIGKLADLTILDRDVLTAGARVKMTILKGETIFES